MGTLPNINQLFVFRKTYILHIVGSFILQSDIDAVYQVMGEQLRLSEEHRTLLSLHSPLEIKEIIDGANIPFEEGESFAFDPDKHPSWITHGPMYGICAKSDARRTILMDHVIDAINAKYKTSISLLGPKQQLSKPAALPGQLGLHVDLQPCHLAPSVHDIFATAQISPIESVYIPTTQIHMIDDPRVQKLMDMYEVSYVNCTDNGPLTVVELYGKRASIISDILLHLCGAGPLAIPIKNINPKLVAKLPKYQKEFAGVIGDVKINESIEISVVGNDMMFTINGMIGKNLHNRYLLMHMNIVKCIDNGYEVITTVKLPIGIVKLIAVHEKVIIISVECDVNGVVEAIHVFGHPDKIEAFKHAIVTDDKAPSWVDVAR
jgi:hypothetical protein